MTSKASITLADGSESPGPSTPSSGSSSRSQSSKTSFWDLSYELVDILVLVEKGYLVEEMMNEIVAFIYLQIMMTRFFCNLAVQFI